MLLEACLCEQNRDLQHHKDNSPSANVNRIVMTLRTFWYYVLVLHASVSGLWYQTKIKEMCLCLYNWTPCACTTEHSQVDPITAPCVVQPNTYILVALFKYTYVHPCFQLTNTCIDLRWDLSSVTYCTSFRRLGKYCRCHLQFEYRREKKIYTTWRKIHLTLNI